MFLCPCLKAKNDPTRCINYYIFEKNKRTKST